MRYKKANVGEKGMYLISYKITSRAPLRNSHRLENKKVLGGKLGTLPNRYLQMRRQKLSDDPEGRDGIPGPCHFHPIITRIHIVISKPHS
jgi:hypothetical protein